REHRSRGSPRKGPGERRRREEQRGLLPPHLDEASARLPHEGGDRVRWLIAGRGDDHDLSRTECLRVAARDVFRKATVDHLPESHHGPAPSLTRAPRPGPGDLLGPAPAATEHCECPLAATPRCTAAPR